MGEEVKKYRRKPLVVSAFKWDGKPNEHVKLLGSVRGEVRCNNCILPWDDHGVLENPIDTVYSILCVGKWVLINSDGQTETMRGKQFEDEYEEYRPSKTTGT